MSKDASGRIAISFPYDPLRVEKVRTIEGRRWHKDKKYWSFPNTERSLFMKSEDPVRTKNFR